MSIKPNKQMMVRSRLVLTIMLLCLTLVTTGSLAKIMIIDGNMYRAKASEQQLYDSMISAPRGDIYDNNMNLLATSSPAWNIYITPNNIGELKNASREEKARQAIAECLSEILGIPHDEVYELTKKDTYYVSI